MVVFSFGPNTAVFSAANRLLLEIAVELLGQFHYAPVGGFDEFRDLIVENKHKNVILFANNPEPKVIEVARRSQAAKIIFTQDPAQAISEIMAINCVDLLSAVRIHSCHYASMEQLVDVNPTNLIPLDGENQDLVALIRAIEKVFGKALSQSNIDAVLSRLCGDLLNPDIFDVAWRERSDRPHRNVRDLFDPRDINAIDIAFPPIQTIPEYGWRWPNRFFYGSTIDTRADEPIHLLGSSRTIFFGPFMYLYPGDWRATYKINIARNWSGNVAMADIQSNLERLAAGKLILPKEGSFEFSLDFTVRSIDTPLKCDFTRSKAPSRAISNWWMSSSFVSEISAYLQNILCSGPSSGRRKAPAVSSFWIRHRT